MARDWMTGARHESSIKYSFPDNQNSTNVVTDSTSDISQVLDYLPYGSARINSGSDVSQRKYIGQFADPTNIDYLNARYYQAGQGQFISEDPVFWSQKMNLQDPQSLNSYSYANDNPINKSDPLGLAAYISASGQMYLGTDMWNGGTYYQSGDAALLNANAAYAQNNKLGSSAGGWQTFKGLVQKGGPWDYLSQANANAGGRGYFFIGNNLVDAETFGNCNYGYAGTAGGFTPFVLSLGAGYAQLKAGDYKLSWAGSFFDDPRDQANIRAGVSGYNQSFVSAVSNFSSNNIQTRASAVSSFNSGVGAPTTQSRTTPVSRRGRNSL
jgi:RHS repeat-associated protein